MLTTNSSSLKHEGKGKKKLAFLQPCKKTSKRKSGHYASSKPEKGCGTYRTKPEKAPCSPQDHLGPALLHELEQFPVHSLGLPSLLSDPSAKTPEEALVHIIGEARRTTPAVLYLPHLPLWWSTVRRL